ncbi:hypothetical protein WT60_27585 [Burkholderia sp. MSMB617WGS]|nr:hypothetical protein WS78_25420 [Burkholderia savannae]AOK50554.1 hypothetical protein WT60_27585 [Burkholderia sp. MSMB617WGS]KVG50086.1 hypothetical protein WS77_23995 [Burkholderia sp. MSMB0265]KVG80820.1 hypothetical protein WS81_12295 [Burkholderia sp. MSMB2040]KVG96764.1 hypothetical protein WS83_02165 [Burkholderia sp. MSMB2042]KVG98864.1 hypothetical protein WS82_26145 [Burkholderia sp. MSMB2041]KVK80876.1 hypothetical protein WS91_11915 [Burkholderia sp. MSMB1498]
MSNTKSRKQACGIVQGIACRTARGARRHATRTHAVCLRRPEDERRKRTKGARVARAAFPPKSAGEPRQACAASNAT